VDILALKRKMTASLMSLGEKEVKMKSPFKGYLVV